MFKKKQISIILAAAMLVSMPVSANVGTGMNDLFNSVGGFANATPPVAYKSQTMNGFSGGSLYMRSPVKTYQLATMQAPSLNIGCGGIDLTAGAFSFINKDALIGLFKNIGTSLSYAFLLAIESSMPEMADLFKNLQNVANKVNGMQINSCQLTSGINFKEKGSISENLSTVVSHVGGSTQNIFEDAFASLNSVKDDAAKQNEVKNAMIAADPSKEELLKPGNVVWRALSRRDGLDNADREFLMSLSGTIVISEPSGSGASSKAPKWSYYPPTIDDVDGLVGPTDPATPAKISIYKCDTVAANGCLTITAQYIPITSFVKMVSDKIDRLQNKIISRGGQTISDFKLLDISSVPIWRLLAASTDINPTLINNYKRMVAIDIAYMYINGMLREARRIMLQNQTGAAGQDAQAALKQLNDGLSELEKKLLAQRQVEAAHVQRDIEMERQLQFLVQTMNAAIPAQAFNSIQAFK